MADLSLFRAKGSTAIPSLEELLTGPEWFGLTTASPAQRAICRIIDGVPLGDLETHPDVIEIVGGPDAVLALRALVAMGVKPSEVLLVAGIRGGKSLLSCAAAIRCALTCDVSGLGPGEVPRVSIVSLDLDKAKATFEHMHGQIEASPKLRALLIGEPSSAAGTLKIRHPSGRAIEIRIVAGQRAGGSLVSRWCAGVIFDEAPRMQGQEDGVVNLDDGRKAVMGRLLPGAQMFLPGSPWAPFGPVFDLISEHFGKPSKGIACIRARGPQMNPLWWTPERCEELRLKDPDLYAVDVECRWANAESGLLAVETIAATTRTEPLHIAPDPLIHYTASMDPATRGNGWAFVVVGNRGTVPGKARYFVAHSQEWIGSQMAPLSSRDTLGAVAAVCNGYRVRSVFTDQHAADTLNEIASEFGLWLMAESWTYATKLEGALRIQRHVTDKTLELPPNPTLLKDLSIVRKRLTQRGTTIDYSITSDGRHCDYAPTLSQAMRHPPPEPMPTPLPPEGDPVRELADRASEKEAARLAVVAEIRKREARMLRRGHWTRS